MNFSRVRTSLSYSMKLSLSFKGTNLFYESFLLINRDKFHRIADLAVHVQPKTAAAFFSHELKSRRMINS